MPMPKMKRIIPVSRTKESTCGSSFSPTCPRKIPVKRTQETPREKPPMRILLSRTPMVSTRARMKMEEAMSPVQSRLRTISIIE